MSQANDTIELAFINPTSGETKGTITESSIGNSTSFHLEKDYFTPANAFAFVIEDDRANQFSQFLQRGWKVQLKLNNCINGIYYIFDYKLSYGKTTAGTRLEIHCKDLLEYMAQGCIYPNMPVQPGTYKNTNLHFQSNVTLGQALTRIAAAFEYVTGNEINVVTDDTKSMTFATGFRTGLRSQGKTPKGRQTSLANYLKHLNTPKKGETYLAYMLRLAKMAAFNIKMSQNDASTIIVKPPTYDRDVPTPFTIKHALNAPENQYNNVIEGQLNFNLDRQPSVVIIETNTAGNGSSFSQSTKKGIAVNEMTGYPINQPVQSAAVLDFPIQYSIPMISDAIDILTNGKYGTGYTLVPFNSDLYKVRNQIGIDINTQVSMPYYSVSANAHDGNEAAFAASMIMAEAQDKYIEFIYKVQGWSQNGVVWQPDMLVNVSERIINGTSLKNFPMWIRKVNYTKSRNGGTETILTLTLPYTHNYEIVEEQTN